MQSFMPHRYISFGSSELFFVMLRLYFTTIECKQRTLSLSLHSEYACDEINRNYNLQKSNCVSLIKRDNFFQAFLFHDNCVFDLSLGPSVVDKFVDSRYLYDHDTI